MRASRPLAHAARTLRASAVGLAVVLTIPGPVAAQLRGQLAEAAPAAFPDAGYRVKAVDGAPAETGVRRVIERFADWTLICDAAKGRHVCNATQSIAAADGRVAFSWSLAATRGGEPVFVVRAPVAAFPARTVTLEFGGAETAMRLPSCDVRLCVGFLPVDPAILKQIRRRGRVGIRYRIADGAVPVEIATSLDGLGAAIGSIR